MVYFSTSTEKFFPNWIFLERVSQVGLQKVDFASIISKSISASIVVSQYNIMLLEAELEPVDQLSKSVLYSIINLCVRVRLFSLAKDIIMCHKIDIKRSKDKSLCKEISRSCNEQEQANGRQD